MSTDLKIDLFAKDVFNALWQHHGHSRAEHPELQQHPKSDEFNDDIFRAVQVRQTMFQLPYKALFENTHAEFYGNRSDFFNAIVDFFPHYLSGEDPEEESVMCMFLSSVAFVADMVLWCESEGDDFLDVADKAWAMFADLRLKDAFYVAGGWEELQCFAKSDLVVYDYMRTFSAVANCYQGKDVMIHQPHLTCGAVESFEEFEVWKGVDEGAPYALKWVDFCVHEPFVKISSPDYYTQPVPFVFNKLEAALWSLNMICDPVKDDDLSEDDDDDDDDFSEDDGDDSDAKESSTCSPTAKTALKEKVLELYREFESANCAIRKETVKDDDCSDNATESFACSSRVKTALIEKVVELGSGLENANSVTREEKSSGLRSTSSSESFVEMSKVIKTENEKSFHYNKIRLPVDNPSLESRVETFRGLEGDLTGLFSQDNVITPNDPSYFCSANDRDDTQQQATQFVQTSSLLKISHQNSILTNDDENYHILEKSLTVLEPKPKSTLNSNRLPKSILP